jgi:hypothetical protein
VRRALNEGELFEAMIVLLNLAEEIQLHDFDHSEILDRFVEILNEAIELARSKQQTD